MPVEAGAIVGPYELLAPIGAGGMGEVWKARDTRLNRIVAVKFSQQQFSERFQREALAVAALNHPNICHLYDIGPNYLVFEYVDGAPVARVDSPRKLLDLAVQIADGLAAAHAAGFMHRDLKPENILVTGANSAHPGRVKILDFGLAKETPTSSASGDGKGADNTRTITTTDPGMIVGTIAYMNPEQARGQATDARGDQFSFGLVLYEMACGKRAFQRASAAETMTAIIREDAEPLPQSIPVPLRWVIERCLAKDPAERYDSTRDLYRELRQAREHLSDAPSGTHVPVTAPLAKTTRRVAVLGTVAGVAAGFLAAAFWPLPPSDPPKVTPFATETAIQSMPAWSPKGDRIAYSADVNGILQIFTKTLGSSIPTQMTHQNESCFSPFWAADGARIYFTSGRFGGGPANNRSLWSVAVGGGQAQKVLDGVPSAALSPDGKTMVVMAPDSPGQYRLAFSSPPGAPPKPYTHPPLSGPRPFAVGWYLHFTPSGKYVGFLSRPRGAPDFWRIPLDGGPPEELWRATDNNLLEFTWLRDDRRVIVSGTLQGDARLRLFDLRTRASRPLTAGVTPDQFPSLSPDGRTLAYATGEEGYDVIEVPLDGSAPRDVIATSRVEVAPAWAPDGVHFAYVTNRSGSSEIWLRNRADGAERLIVGQKDFPGQAGVNFLDCSISPDGSRIAYRVTGSGSVDIWISPLSGEAPVRLWDDPAREYQRGSSWSPDGNWIAYYSTRDGKDAVLKARVGASVPPELVAYASALNPVRWSPRGDWIAFNDNQNLRIVSPDGKRDRIVSRTGWETYGWSKDGSAIYGIAIGQDRRLMLGRIDIATGTETKVSDLGPAPSAAFDIASARFDFAFRGFSLNPDGKSFLTSIFRTKLQIYLMQDFDRPARLVDYLMDGWWKK
ncbi:MAG TPA: protein kinase [Bryobacteraceae bacterium]|nr:protein kinase [Bryobacteraceae bacterium]